MPIANERCSSLLYALKNAVQLVTPLPSRLCYEAPPLTPRPPPRHSRIIFKNSSTHRKKNRKMLTLKMTAERRIAPYGGNPRRLGRTKSSAAAAASASFAAALPQVSFEMIFITIHGERKE